MSRGRHTTPRGTRRPVRTARRILVTAIVAAVVAIGAAALVVRPGANANAHAPKDRASEGSSHSPLVIEPTQIPAIPSDTSSNLEDSTPWMVFASAGDVRLTLPVQEPEAVAFHQAYYGDAMAMHPIGHLERNAFKSEFTAPPQQEDGPGYIIQAPRGRGTGPTTAVDIVAPAQAEVMSPVDGTVTQVKRYKLYGQYPDMVVRIRPAADPHAEVAMLHLTNVQVHDGDEVRASLSVIGQPRKFPFHSEVNDYVAGGDPHVHIEVKTRQPAKQSSPA